MKRIRHIRITIWTYIHVCIEVVDEDGDNRSSSSDEDDCYENGYDNDDSSYDSDDER